MLKLIGLVVNSLQFYIYLGKEQNTMKNIIIPVCFALLLIACKNEEKSTTTEEIANTTEEIIDSETSVETSVEATPENNSDNTAAPVMFGNKEVALNPPHGQPGHKCEIPVGAPLDGSGGTTANPITPQPQASGSSSLPSNSFFAQKPTATSSQPTQTITTTPQPTPQPTPQSQPATPQPVTQTTEPGFSGKPNPAHGQPGHRCDVAVGATLP